MHDFEILDLTQSNSDLLAQRAKPRKTPHRDADYRDLLCIMKFDTEDSGPLNPWCQASNATFTTPRLSTWREVYEYVCSQSKDGFGICL